MKIGLEFFARAIAGSALFTALMGSLNIVFDQDWGIRSGADVLALPKHPIELLLLVMCLLLLAGLLEVGAHAGKIFQTVKKRPAVAFGMLAVLTALVVVGGNVGLTMLMGGPLQRAVEMGNTERVEALVQQNRYEAAALAKPLYFALKQADFAMAEALVRTGADVNHREDGEFASPLLISSVFHFEPAAIAFLLSHGANPNLQDNLGRTAMMVAVSYRPEEAVNLLEMLHEAGGDMAMEANNGDTVSAIATQNNHTAVISYLEDLSVQATTLAP